jgi:predicted Zn-dependent protease
MRSYADWAASTACDDMSRTERHLGERLHSLLLRSYGLKTRDFSHDCVDRVMAALNDARFPAAPMLGEVLWMSPPTAFTLPGPYCYITRRFIERCGSDAPAAFALAHEIGHHDLGHLKRAERWAGGATYLQVVILTILGLTNWIYSREMELAADAYALELCRKAGFDLKQCLESFDILRWYLLDYRDLDGIYGTDEESEIDPKLAANPIDRLYLEARLWLARRRRSHPAIHERRRILQLQIGDAEPAGKMPKG